MAEKLHRGECSFCCPGEKWAYFTREEEYDDETGEFHPVWKCTNCYRTKPRRAVRRGWARYRLQVQVIENWGTPERKAVVDKETRHYDRPKTHMKARALRNKLITNLTWFHADDDGVHHSMRISGWDDQGRRVEIVVLDMGDAKERARARKEYDNYLKETREQDAKREEVHD